jgi:polar amino acid transport system substrate-binding protein
MVKKALFAFVAVALLAGIPFLGLAKQKAAPGKKLVIATDATWPPMEYVDEYTKEIVGFDIDFMKAVADAGGFGVEFKSTAWDGIFAGLATDKYDAIISSVTITEERKKEMDFSKPYVNAGQLLVVQKNLKGVAALADLKGKTAGAQIGTTGAFEIEKVKGVTLKSYDEIGLAFEDLVNGRIAAVVCDTPVAANYALQNQTYKGKLKIAGAAFTQEFYGVVVKKGNTQVLDMINAGIDKVLDTKKYDELKKKWLK